MKGIKNFTDVEEFAEECFDKMDSLGKQAGFILQTFVEEEYAELSEDSITNMEGDDTETVQLNGETYTIGITFSIEKD